jgi:KDO2-lipid IV(A) lauroyltransferase
LESVFGDRFSARERDRIAWISWRNTVFNAVEALRIARVDLKWFQSVFDYEHALRVLKEQARTGRGAIIALPHMGNWELAGIGCHLLGIPTFNIAAKQRNPLVNSFFNRLRSSTGVETLERGTASMRQVIRNLKQGKFLGILPDSRMHKEGIRMPLLGGEANLGKGMALFARHADIPIFPCVVTRIGWARHRVRCFAAVRPDPARDKEADVARMTAAVIEIMDRAIRDEPEQWFWFNKRWVLDPPVSCA